jgi:hypothetical protein
MQTDTEAYRSSEIRSFEILTDVSAAVSTFRNMKSCNLVQRRRYSGGTRHLTELCRPCDRVSLMYSFKYNQQVATLYNILYYCQCSTCFGRFLRPSSGAQNCKHSMKLSSLLLLPLAVAASKTGTYQMLCIQLLSAWWSAEKPLETCRALTVIKNIV